MVSNGRPRAALARFDALAPLPTPGAWATAGGNTSSALVLDLRTLPATGGLSVLRFLRFPSHPEEARERTARLLGDEDLPITMRRALMEAIMSDRIPIDIDERESAWDQAIRRGIEIGERRGIEIGERQALLTLARQQASPHIVAGLEQETDLDELRRRVFALLSSE